MTRYYFDTSALLKRDLQEDHSAALIQFVDQLIESGHELFTSVLGSIETERARRRLVAAGVLEGPLQDSVAIDGLAVVPIDDRTAKTARWIGPESLRSLDAIHLASAVVNDADVFVTYDDRLGEAARAVELKIEAPGLDQVDEGLTAKTTLNALAMPTGAGFIDLPLPPRSMD